jgi:type II secretory pathway component GspD/PulD (secretin)
LPRSALLPTLETLLNQNGATLTVRDGIYRVAPLAAGAVAGIVAGPGAVGSGTEVVPLRYAAAQDLVKVLEPYVTEGGKITAEPGRNALIVSGDTAVRQTLASLIRAFDIDVLAGQSYALFPAGSGNPDKMAAELEKVFRTGGEGRSPVSCVSSRCSGSMRCSLCRTSRVISMTRGAFSVSNAVSRMRRRGHGTSITCRTARAPIWKTCCSGPSPLGMSRREPGRPAPPHPAPNRCEWQALGVVPAVEGVQRDPWGRAPAEPVG